MSKIKLTEQARAARNAYQGKWRKANAQKVREYQASYLKKWRQANPQKIREYQASYWERVAQRKKEKETVTRVSVSNNVTTAKSSVTSQITVTKQKVCQECGKMFSAKRSTARFCSTACRVNFNRKIKLS